MVADRVTRREWRNALIWALALMALTTIPYLACAASGGDEWAFGGSVLGVEDGNSYLAKMRQGARGEWLFHIVYTSEAHEGALLFLPYILMGKIAAVFADPTSPELVNAMIVVFHAARLVFGVLLVLVTYRLAAAFLPTPTTRLAATVIATAGGGLGWLLSLVGLGEAFGSPPIDFFVPEGYTFLILYHLPHLSLSRSLMLLGLLLLFGPPSPFGSGAGGEGNMGWLPRALLAGLCWVGMGLCVPFYITVLYLILGVWGLGVWIKRRVFPWDLFWRAVVGASVTLPLLLYTAYHFTRNAVFAQWSAQNLLYSPHPFHYLAGYIALIIPALWGIRWAWQRRWTRDLLLVSWLVAAPLLVYLPVNVQRRLAEGVFAPLGILAAAGLRLLAPQIARRLNLRRRRAWNLALGLTLILVLPTSLFLLAGGTLQAVRPGWPIFHAVDELAALDWLNADAPAGAVVLSSFETGNYLPARTDLRAFLGHGPETFRSEAKREIVEAFFTGAMSDEERATLFTEYSIAYVFYGPQEGAAPGAPAPEWAAGLRVIYQDAGYTIYETPQ